MTAPPPIVKVVRRNVQRVQRSAVTARVLDSGAPPAGSSGARVVQAVQVANAANLTKLCRLLL